jgi:hypothetical protein
MECIHVFHFSVLRFSITKSYLDRNMISKYKFSIVFALFILSIFTILSIATAVSSYFSLNLPADRVLTILKSENLDFLVRRRQVTQVVLIRTADTSWWDWVPYVGDIREMLKEEGVLTANVKVYYGFDMKKLSNKSISDSGNTITITLPEPEVLDYAVDIESLKFRSIKKGVATRIGNAFRDESLKDKLQKDIKLSVDEFVSFPGTMPTKNELLQEMAGFEKLMTNAYKVRVKFN